MTHEQDDEQGDELDDNSAYDEMNAGRETIRQELAEIAAELGDALREADLNYPVFLVVPSGGEALISVGTSHDPDDATWHRISGIVCDVLSRRVGGAVLRSRELSCAMTNAALTLAEVPVAN